MVKEIEDNDIDSFLIDTFFGDMIKDVVSRPKTKEQASLTIRAFEKIIKQLKVQFDIED